MCSACSVAQAVVTGVLLGTAVRLRLDGTELTVGRAVLDLSYVSAVRGLDAEATARRGPVRTPTPAPTWCSGRYVKTAVELTLDDPADPVPYWIVSTRRPTRLAEAITAVLTAASARPAAVTDQTPTEFDLEVGYVALDDGLAPPAYAHHDDAGADLVSAETFVLQPGERRLVGTGVAIALPEGYAGFVHPRSGLAARHGISIVNAPGTVDAGYRGEILVCLVNTDPATAVRISRGDRIAQLVVQRVARARFVAVPQLPDSTPAAGRTRGTGGHGSTGGSGRRRHHRRGAATSVSAS